MSTLQQIRQDLSQAWDHLRDGWQRLQGQAAGALTRFTLRGENVPVKASTKGRGDWWPTIPGTAWGLLAADVLDEDDKVLVRLEAPGMDKNALELQVRDGYLVVRGEKRAGRERSEGRYHITECAYGHFERVIALPDAVRADLSSARYKNGVLEIELPKDPARKPRRIKVAVH